MRRTACAAAVCLTGLLAGCGSSSRTPSHTGRAGAGGSMSSMIHLGPAGTMGPPSSGAYNATNLTVLQHIESVLARFFTAKGFTSVRVRCTGVKPTTAMCTVTGTNNAGQRSSAVVTISVNPTTGALRVVHVSSAYSTTMTYRGPAGTMGPAKAGRYSALNGTVLAHIDAALTRFFIARGFIRVSVDCQGVNPSTASCTVTGTSRAGRTVSGLVTVAINQVAGSLRIIHVRIAYTTPGAMRHTGPAGTMGPPRTGRYSALDHTVLRHIAIALVRFFSARGFFDVVARCEGVNPRIALCRVAGRNRHGRRSFAIVTVAVNPITGALRIVHVA